MNELVTITLPIELTNGNDGRGSRWFSSANVRKKIEKTLRTMGLVCKPFEFPVVLHITRVFGKRGRLWDADSIGRGNSKELIDAMVACGWFYDDSSKWITETRFFQRKSEDGKAAVQVSIYASMPVPF